MQPHQFYEVLPDGRYRFRVDHHLINDYNLCDRYFSYHHMASPAGQVWAAKTLNFKIALGSWWSSTMESLYHEMSCGVMPSEHHIYKFATDAWADHKMEAYASSDPETFAKFGGINGGRAMALEYYNAFAKQHFTQWTVLGPELGFGWSDELMLGEDDKVVVYYGGKPDLVIVDRSQNMIMPLDFKTKDSVPSNASVQYKPHPQTAGYIFAVGKMINQIIDKQCSHEFGVPDHRIAVPSAPTKCIIMVCARFRPTDKPRSGIRQPRFLPVYPNYSEAEIEEWRFSVIEKCRRLRDSIERSYFPPRESACHLFYHGCMFRRVCSVPSVTREAVLKSDFIQTMPWIPYDSED